MKAASFAHSINKTVILNVAPYSDDLKQLYLYVDFITLNAYQASDWSGIEINTINDAKQAVEIIAGNEKKKSDYLHR
ncbi:hypothetical protein IC611_12920 [Proteus mirabilis]